MQANKQASKQANKQASIHSSKQTGTQASKQQQETARNLQLLYGTLEGLRPLLD